MQSRIPVLADYLKSSVGSLELIDRIDGWRELATTAHLTPLDDDGPLNEEEERVISEYACLSAATDAQLFGDQSFV